MSTSWIEELGPKVWTATITPPTGNFADRSLGWYITVNKNGMTLCDAKFALTRRRAERKAQRWVDRLERDDAKRDQTFTVEANQ